jgi:hypothetical protein
VRQGILAVPYPPPPPPPPHGVYSMVPTYHFLFFPLPIIVFPLSNFPNSSRIFPNSPWLRATFISPLFYLFTTSIFTLNCPVSPFLRIISLFHMFLTPRRCQLIDPPLEEVYFPLFRYIAASCWAGVHPVTQILSCSNSSSGSGTFRPSILQRSGVPVYRSIFFL